ncbi:calcium-dependent protein kinase C-like isoform X1 [Cataglyphis hispanica]|uniref:calcium-dependent protein kinase C-like isoform X1 n=1 Tax=Cataglyphis hispanica TaxID=1086592 RepID=UPI00217FDDD5|nr:calcium-dependent protein kinase C-like isoform X1 [Cataglyphis hispanica]
MRLQNPVEDFVPDTKDTIDEALMLKGSLSPYLDTHNEEESSYVTLSNGPYAYVADSTSAEHNSYNHILVDVYFVTPILCKHCEDYIWGTGKVGTKCKESFLAPNALNGNKKSHSKRVNSGISCRRMMHRYISQGCMCSSAGENGDVATVTAVDRL